MVKTPIPTFFFLGASNRCDLNVGIGSPDLSQRFQKRWDRSHRFSDPVPAFLLVSGQPLRKCEYNLYQRFWKRWHRYYLCQHFQKRWYRPFKSTGIGYIQIFVKAVPTQVKMPEQGLKSAGTYPGAIEKCWYRSSDPILTFKPQQFEAPGQKTPG